MVRGLRSEAFAAVAGCSSRAIDRGPAAPREPEGDVRDAVGMEAMASSVHASMLISWIG